MVVCVEGVALLGSDLKKIVVEFVLFFTIHYCPHLYLKMESANAALV